MRFTIRRKILLFTVVPGVMVLSGLLGMNAWKLYGRELQIMDKEVTLLARRHSRQVDGVLREAAQAVRTTAAVVGLSEGLGEADYYAIIQEGSGTAFDPEIVAVFLELNEAFRAVALENADYDEERETLTR